MDEEKNFGIYVGVRDKSFEILISNILGDISSKYKRSLLSDSSMSY